MKSIPRFNKDESDNDSSGESDLDPEEHIKSLKQLQDTDPEFYSFLEKNDKKLLNFNLSDNENADDDDDDYGNDSDEKQNSIHVPNAELEIGSDESDYEVEEDENSSRGKIKVTLNLIKSWQEELRDDKSSKTIKTVIEVFHAAVESITGKDENNQEPSRYKVEGSAVFNAVVQMCIMHLPAAVKSFLGLETESHFEVHKAKKFGKVKGTLKSYLTDLLKLLRCVSSSNIIAALLKHLHQILPFTYCYSSLRKPLIKILLKFWSSGEETVRIVAFLSIIKMATGQKESVYETLVKTMYIKYVQNSSFVSPSLLPGINFMRHSLAEIYLLDCKASYNHAFLFVRQLAINLRNAVTLKQKENFQAVYNWQFINSLRFWAELILRSKPQSLMRQILYPLVQIITGTIKMVPTCQYYPLRFHCVKMLISIKKETDIFIPVLPFLTEILQQYSFNQQHKVAAMKEISLICLLRVSKIQQQEKSYKDSILENIYGLILENAANESYKVYFSDAYIPCVVELKAFLKKTNVANYSRKIKQLNDKIEENRKFIEKERAKLTFDSMNVKEIGNWEKRLENEGTPLSKFYDAWLKLHNLKQLKMLTQNDEIADNKLPSVKKDKGKNKRHANDDENSDLDMPVEEFERRQQKKKQKKASKVKKAKYVDEELPKDNTDIVRDSKVDDWD